MAGFHRARKPDLIFAPMMSPASPAFPGPRTRPLQEENNLKTVLTDQRALSIAQPYLAREYGFARYERIRDADFAAADRYYERTKEFWDRVRDRWNETFSQQGVVTLIGPVDKLGLFGPLFERAD